MRRRLSSRQAAGCQHDGPATAVVPAGIAAVLALLLVSGTFFSSNEPAAGRGLHIDAGDLGAGAQSGALRRAYSATRIEAGIVEEASRRLANHGSVTGSSSSSSGAHATNVVFTLVVEGVEFSELDANATLRGGFEAGVKDGIVATAFLLTPRSVTAHVRSEDVHITLAVGSVSVGVSIAPRPTGMSAERLASLLNHGQAALERTVMDSVLQVSGINALISGSLWVRASEAIADAHDDHDGHHHHRSGAFIPIAFLLFTYSTAAFCQEFVKILPQSFRPPHSLALFIAGLFFSRVAARGASETEFGETLMHFTDIDPHVIFWVLLPALLYEDAANSQWHVIQRVLPSALLLALPGVIINTVLTGFFIRYVLNLPIEPALLLGSILSATDPVAVVGALQALHAPAKLSSLISGESLFNDGSAVALFQIFLEVAAHREEFSIGSSFTKLCRLALGGPAFGMGVAIVANHCLRTTRSFTTEILIIVVCIYGTFFMSEHAEIQVSGVLAVVIFGFFMSSTGHFALLPENEEGLHAVVEFLALLSNEAIFFIAGIVGYKFFDNVWIGWSDWGHLLLLYVGVHVTRALVLVISWPLLSQLGYGVSWKEILICVYGGLRGAVGLAMALMVSPDVDIDEDIRAKIGFHTSGIVLLTLLVNATTITSLYQRLQIQEKRKEVNHHRLVDMALEEVDRNLHKYALHLREHWFFSNCNIDLVLAKLTRSLRADNLLYERHIGRRHRVKEARGLVDKGMKEIAIDIANKATQPKDAAHYMAKLRYARQGEYRWNAFAVQSYSYSEQIDELESQLRMVAMLAAGKDQKKAVEVAALTDERLFKWMWTDSKEGAEQCTWWMKAEEAIGSLSEYLNGERAKEPITMLEQLEESEGDPFFFKNVAEAIEFLKTSAMENMSKVLKEEDADGAAESDAPKYCQSTTSVHDEALQVAAAVFQIKASRGAVELTASKATDFPTASASTKSAGSTASTGLAGATGLSSLVLPRINDRKETSASKASAMETVSEFDDDSVDQEHHGELIHVDVDEDKPPASSGKASKSTNLTRKNTLEEAKRAQENWAKARHFVHKIILKMRKVERKRLEETKRNVAKELVRRKNEEKTTVGEMMAEIYQMVVNTTRAGCQQMFEARVLPSGPFNLLMTTLDYEEEAVNGDLKAYPFLRGDPRLLKVASQGKSNQDEQIAASFDVAVAHVMSKLRCPRSTGLRLIIWACGGLPLTLEWKLLKRDVELVLALVMEMDDSYEDLEDLDQDHKVLKPLNRARQKLRSDVLFHLATKDTILFAMVEHVLLAHLLLCYQIHLVRHLAEEGAFTKDDAIHVEKMLLLPFHSALAEYVPDVPTLDTAQGSDYREEQEADSSEAFLETDKKMEREKTPESVDWSPDDGMPKKASSKEQQLKERQARDSTGLATTKSSAHVLVQQTLANKQAAILRYSDQYSSGFNTFVKLLNRLALHPLDA